MKNSKPISVTVADHKDDIADDVLLIEKFEDGSVTKLPGSKENPVWSGITYANLVELIDNDGTKRIVWHKDFMSGYHFTGNELWTDYALSMDLQFSEKCDLNFSNTVAIFIRQREWDIYGKFHYGIYLTGGNTISICKSFASAEYSTRPLISKTLSYLEDIGVNNRIRIEALDNTVTIFWNGVEVIRYVDEDPLIIPFGKIGFMTIDTSVYIGNIIVTEIDDPLGGAYDNLVGGFWDEPTPENFFYSYDAEDRTISETPNEIATNY